MSIFQKRYTAVISYTESSNLRSKQERVNSQAVNFQSQAVRAVVRRGWQYRGWRRWLRCCRLGLSSATWVWLGSGCTPARCCWAYCCWTERRRRRRLRRLVLLLLPIHHQLLGRGERGGLRPRGGPPLLQEAPRYDAIFSITICIVTFFSLFYLLDYCYWLWHVAVGLLWFSFIRSVDVRDNTVWYELGHCLSRGIHISSRNLK